MEMLASKDIISDPTECDFCTGKCTCEFCQDCGGNESADDCECECEAETFEEEYDPYECSCGWYCNACV